MLLTTRKFLLGRMYRTMYWAISYFDKEQDVVFMNYGYFDGNDLQLNEKDEANRYPVRLYDFVVNHASIEGLDVLEVGSGRGGGAEYITRNYRPKSYRGLDLSKKAVESSNRHYANDILSFVQGNAQELPFQDNSFDVVINVESSHGYPDFGKFFNEVYRVLKPDGHFLFTDFRMTADDITVEFPYIGDVHDRIKESKFKVIYRKVITPNIIQALDRSHERRLEQIGRITPRFLQSMSKSFTQEVAAIKGTTMYEWFESGKCEYFFYMFQK